MQSTEQLYKILVIGPSWVGDMVMAQSLFATIRKQSPNALIDVLAPEWSLPLLKRMAEVNQGISIPIGHGQLQMKQRRAIAKSLAQTHYRQAIVLPNSLKSALIPWLAKIPLRTGWRGEYRYGLINDIRRLDKQAYPTMVERFVAFAYPEGFPIPQIPFPKLTVSPEQSEEAANHFKISCSQPALALCPGAEYGPAKQWPAEYFAKTANEKLSQGWAVWIFGSAKDVAIADEINGLTDNRCTNLAGETNLAQAVDLLALTNAVVTNDSGLMHIAAALDRPLVAVYGSSDPKFTPPMSPQAITLSLQLSCSPCFKRECPLEHLHCLKQLTPDRVLAALP